MEKTIGKNMSSGAKKVERVEKENFSQESVDTVKPAQTKKKGTTKKSGTVSKTTAAKTPKKTAQLKEEVAADKRVEAARKRAEKKQEKLEKKASIKEKQIEKRAALKEKKLAKKQAAQEKRLAHKTMLAEKKAELKAKRAERKAERIARREMLKNESKAERQKRLEREKKERLALKRQKREAREKARENKLKAREAAHARKAEDRKHKREQKNARRTPGFGGWLAAVISLGTACLILSAIVTAGAFRMNDMAVEAESGARSTLYEMVSVSEDLDENLGKLRISSGANEQRKLLTDILVDTALLESAIEKIPVDTATGTDISSFINRTGSYARQMLAKLAKGQALSAEEKENVANLYAINDQLYSELNELVNSMSSGDIRDMLTGGGNMIEKLTELGERTRPEPRQPKELSEAPFAKEGNIGQNRLALLEEISSSEAEALARQYFESYHVKDVRYTGETVAREIACYNFVLTDENDVEIFAEISKRGGKLTFFDTYEECTQKNFDLETCDAIAREFLKGIGIESVEAVWLSDGGMVANLTYTTLQNGVRIYPEIIRIRVCEEKGRVVGMDARGYFLNDKEWRFDHSISEQDARRALSAGLEPYAVNLALIPVDGEEVLCYEFGCTYGEDEYIVYLDANSGDEVLIYRVRTSAKGSYLR